MTTNQAVQDCAWVLTRVQGYSSPRWMPLFANHGIQSASEVKDLEIHAYPGAFLHVEGMIAPPFQDSAEKVDVQPLVNAWFKAIDVKTGMKGWRWNVKPETGSTTSLWRPDFTRDGNKNIRIAGLAFDVNTVVEVSHV